MKMRFVFAIAAIGTLAFASCRKDYNCYCTDDNGNKYLAAKYENTKKATAESACTSYGVFGISCEIE